MKGTFSSDLAGVNDFRFGDVRGFFSEVYSRRAFAEAGIDLDFVQDNHSLSVPRGTVRGLHFQSPPHAQDKLIRVVRGSILDLQERSVESAQPRVRGPHVASPPQGRPVAEQASLAALSRPV